jgi:hypothetical protein
VALDKSPAPAVLGIISVVRRVQRSRVGDQWAANSDLRISSIRCETSLRPLRPAAPRRRLPPSTRWVSMAWRVSSDTVIPRLSASWRSLASSSSGSLTVVRFMVCQHTLADSSLTAVRANLGVRWRTDDSTRGRFSYSGERQRTTTNTRLAVSKTAEGNLVRVRLPLSAPSFLILAL